MDSTGVVRFRLGSGAYCSPGLGANLYLPRIRHAGPFTRTLHAFKAAALNETLCGKGSRTVFVPTDEAIMQLPADSLNVPLKDTRKRKAIGRRILAGRQIHRGWRQDRAG